MTSRLERKFEMQSRLKTMFCIVALALALPLPAMAQDITPISQATFLNILYGALATLITTGLIPLAYYWIREKIAQRKLAVAQLEEQLRGTLDAGVQKAIGGALGKIEIPEGKLTGNVKVKVVNEAADAVAKNFPQAFADLGIEDVQSKAKEMVESRVGMMDAQAAGNPVPNPSQPIAAPATQNVTVAPNKK